MADRRRDFFVFRGVGDLGLDFGQVLRLDVAVVGVVDAGGGEDDGRLRDSGVVVQHLRLEEQVHNEIEIVVNRLPPHLSRESPRSEVVAIKIGGGIPPRFWDDLRKLVEKLVRVDGLPVPEGVGDAVDAASSEEIFSLAPSREPQEIFLRHLEDVYFAVVGPNGDEGVEVLPDGRLTYLHRHLGDGVLWGEQRLQLLHGLECGVVGVLRENDGVIIEGKTRLKTEAGSFPILQNHAAKEIGFMV